MTPEEVKKEVKREIAEAMVNNLPAGVGEIVIREGKAVEIHEPVKVVISGTLDAAARWLETRMPLEMVNEKACHILVDREKLSISLQCNENNHYGSLISGKLIVSPEYEKFGINSGEYMTNFEMAELIKMNRSYFENRQVAMKLVTELQNFKAKVEKELENSNNNRGDRRILINQAVQSNLPEAFTLIIPLFKGTSKQTIQVEVYINPSDFSCTLVSPEANDLLEEMRDKEIDLVLGRIQKVCPHIVIIEK